jgi:hypothetical protein
MCNLSADGTAGTAINNMGQPGTNASANGYAACRDRTTTATQLLDLFIGNGTGTVTATSRLRPPRPRHRAAAGGAHGSSIPGQATILATV